MDAKEKLAAFLKNKNKVSDSEVFSDLCAWLTEQYSDGVNFVVVKGYTMSWLVITQKEIKDRDPGAVQLQISSDNSFKLKVLSAVKMEGVFEKTPMQTDPQFLNILAQLCGKSYHVCPGIKDYSKYYKTLRFHSKHVRQWDATGRVDSDTCKLWHSPGKHYNDGYEYLCTNCISLKTDLNNLVLRLGKLSTPQKEARLKPNSKRGLKFMSPRAQKKRRQSQTTERSDLKKLLKKMKESDVELNGEQSEEMSKVGKIIEKDHAEDLEEILSEAAEYNESKKTSLSQIWNLDMQNRSEFADDQKKNTTGHRGNRWSLITYRMALAVYIRSPSAYKSLSSFKILNLPSKRSLQKFTSNNIDEPGDCSNYLLQQAKKYEMMCAEIQSKDKPIPDGYGALIFDEVKVIAKVLYNSKNNALIGFAMSPDELSSLQDIYLHLDPNCRKKKTNYILQFLWRDLCSNFDVLGPYYTCNVSLEHKYVIACVLDALRKLHSYGFKTKVIICDGASSNLTSIKYFMGHQGTFGHHVDNGVISHQISPRVYNPLTGENVFFMICPTHQMKNVISQLYASRPSGAKGFVNNDISFGWTPIREIYNEDVERAQQGHLQQVPGLKLNYVVRDAWTRLNVKPSKIMCQDNMIAALKILADSKGNLQAKQSITMTVEYLQACNAIFETGILSSFVIRQSNTRALHKILQGQNFFEQWLTRLLQQPGAFNPNDNKQKYFLSWQTWDLQRVMVYGFKELCDDFIRKYGDNFFISPKRLNGSAIETLFSQFKNISGGQLTAANYQTAKAAYLMRVDLHGRHHGENDYRNVPLYLREWHLMRR